MSHSLSRLAIASFLSASTLVAYQVTAADNAAASQISTPKAAEPTSEPALEEVVVTAERRSENVQTTPIAVSVISGTELERDQIKDVDGLQYVTPALTIGDAGITKFINIRGVGLNASNPGLSTGIAYHVDGLFTRELGLSTPYYDIANVEVLRGPQGTLAGQNATGGAIFVVSQTPKYGKNEGDASVSYGNYDHITTEAALNLAASDTVAIRLATYTNNRNSYFTNLDPGTTNLSYFQPGNVNQLATRLSVAAKPIENLEIILRGEYFNQTSDGFGRKSFNDPITDPFVLSFYVPTKADLRSERLSAEVKYYITDSIELRSLSGYQRNILNNMFDTDGSSDVQVGTLQQINQPFFSQELNLISTGNSALQWVLGAYYFKTLDTTSAHVAFAALDIHGVPSNESKAAFAQFTYALNDRLQIVAGIRENRETDADDQRLQLLLVPGQPTLVTPSSVTTSAVTGKLGVNFNLTQDQFLYAVASKGFRAGGTNFAPSPNFGPETIFNYEVGWKATAFNQHLRTQLDAYYDTYKDVQLTVVNPVTPLPAIANAGAATIRGVEAQVQAVFGHLAVDGSAAYIKSKLGSALFINPVNPASVPVQLGGRPMPYAPTATASLGIEYAIPVGPENATLTPRLQYSYTDQQWATVFQGPYDSLASFDVFNFHLTYARKSYSVGAYVTNIANKTYISGNDGTYDYYGPRREYGIKYNMHF